MIIQSYKALTFPAVPGKMSKLNQFESSRMFVDYYLLEPDQQQRPHTHDANDKLYFVVRGKGMFLLGETEHELVEGEGCVAEAGVIHGVRNHTSEPLVLLVSMAPHPSHG